MTHSDKIEPEKSTKCKEESQCHYNKTVARYSAGMFAELKEEMEARTSIHVGWELLAIPRPVVPNIDPRGPASCVF